MRPLLPAAIAIAVLCAASSAGAGEPLELGGLELELTLTEVSGLYFSSEAYQNQAAVSLSPRFLAGRRFFEGKWAEPLTLSAELSVEAELMGNDSSFRGTSFASPALFRSSPEQLPLLSASGQVEGTGRRAVISDLTLAASHEKLALVPGAELKVSSDLKVVLPTSTASQVAGLWAAPSASVGLGRELGPLGLGASFRAVKYFFGSTVAKVAPLEAPFVLNGREEQPYRPASSGVANPSHGFTTSLGVELELPRELSLSAEYSLVHTWAYPLEVCAVDGVPTADVCRDGSAVGFVQKVGQRDDHSFYLEVGWKPAEWASLALGLSTYRPVRADTLELTNPFIHVSPYNYSTVYLSLKLSAAELASAIKAR
ncbi:MAG: hypothetical protein HYZ28_25110 [Myxococcales bacterium]|nr:hypothetical protein [Myxococcales bacterium]